MLFSYQKFFLAIMSFIYPLPPPPWPPLVYNRGFGVCHLFHLGFWDRNYKRFKLEEGNGLRSSGVVTPAPLPLIPNCWEGGDW